MRLYDEYIKRLIVVNDETKSEHEHRLLQERFRGWQEGVENAAGHRFNGDYYYIDLGIDRPMCRGEFLDWNQSNPAFQPTKKSVRLNSSLCA